MNLSLLSILLLFILLGLCLLTVASTTLAVLRGEPRFSILITRLQILGFVSLCALFATSIGILVLFA
jgi:hypothetical protein